MVPSKHMHDSPKHIPLPVGVYKIIIIMSTMMLRLKCNVKPCTCVVMWYNPYEIATAIVIVSACELL